MAFKSLNVGVIYRIDSQGALTSGYRAYVVFCGGHFEFLIRAWSGTEI